MIKIPEDADRYHAHPAMLDGVFQLVGFMSSGSDGDGSSGQSWVPAGIDRAEMHDSIGRSTVRIGKDASVWAHARVVEANTKARVLDFSIYHVANAASLHSSITPVMTLQGFRFAVLPPQPPSSAIYEICWAEAPCLSEIMRCLMGMKVPPLQWC